MRSTPSRRATATGALIAAAAMLTLGVQSGTASAGTFGADAPAAGHSLGKVNPGKLPADLSPPSAPR